jgi:hypothetical protein
MKLTSRFTTWRNHYICLVGESHDWELWLFKKKGDKNAHWSIDGLFYGPGLVPHKEKHQINNPNLTFKNLREIKPWLLIKLL